MHFPAGLRQRFLAAAFCLAALLTLLPSSLVAQTRPETIRGRVTSDSGAPVRDATISATKADRSFQQATSGADGSYAIHFDSGTGDYLVHASAVGYTAVRIRVTAKPGDSVLVADIKLKPNVTQLAAVKVTASKPKPSRGGDPASDAGARERISEGVFATLTPGQQGDLAALASVIPGMRAGAGGVSVFGLDGSQSSTTLNGMAFDGASLPRDAQRSTGIVTSPFDPAVGGFSGARTNVSLSPGSTYFQRRSHVTFDAPPLQTTDPISRQLGQQTFMFDGSLGSSGPLATDRYLYSVGLQATRTAADAASLLTADSDLLRIAGISPDSASRLAQLLTTSHIPLTATGAPLQRLNQRVLVSARFDRSPYKPGTYQDAPSTWNVLTIANVNTSDDAAGPTSISTRGSSLRSFAWTTQGTYSRFFNDVLTETRAAFNLGGSNGTPALRLPTGSVLVSSTLPDADDGIASLLFGGSAASEFARRNWTLEVTNDTKWYTPGAPHRLKATAEARIDGYSSSGGYNSLGSFSYNSLAAIGANTPTSFSRTLSSPARAGGEVSEYFAIGDYWRRSPTFKMVYGARVEANQYTTSLVSNPEIATLFGASTTTRPERVHVSPRMGFTWYNSTEGGNGIRFSQLGQQSFGGTQTVWRGGIGEFRNFLPAALLSDASVSNGIPGYVTQLTCIGSAVPTPQWSQYALSAANIPTSCAGGAGGVFNDAAPSVRVFEQSYNAPRSWRAMLGNERRVAGLTFSVDATYSLNVDQQGLFDLNFAGVPKFTLADEGGRPVFANVSSIVPATGAVSPVDARSHAAYGRVVQYRSDLRSTSKQVTATLLPVEWGKYLWSFAYSLGQNTADARGFDDATFGSPVTMERAAGVLDVRHQVQGSIGRQLPHGMSLSIFARLESGRPFTPLVSGDVNGDGMSNDRAFVFNPATATDPKLAADLRSLLATGPANARDCLSAQLGAPAARNSCRAPWAMYMNANLALFSRSGPTRRSISAALNISNPLAGIDQLLHGAGNLHGWGSTGAADPILYTVRGFDPQAQRFHYEVNPRFGSVYSSQLLGRTPVRLTIDFNIDLGTPVVIQQASRLLAPGRRGDARPRMSVDSIASKMRVQVPDIYKQTLDLSDSLLISRTQTEALQKAREHYRVRIDSLWTSVATYIASLGDDYDTKAVANYMDDATDKAWIVGRDEIPTLETILTPTQMRLAPWTITSLKASGNSPKIGMRIYMY